MADSDWEDVSDEWVDVDSGQKPYEGVQPQNILGKIFNVPAAAIRSTIQGRGYMAGALNPDAVPTFQEMSLNAPVPGVSAPPQNPFEFIGQYGAGLARDIVGAGADMVTNPANLLMGIAGKVVSGTTPAKAFERFLTKQRLPGKNIGRVLDTKKGSEFSGQIRKEFVQTKARAVEQFGKQLDDLVKADPEKTISLQNLVDDISTNMDDMAVETKNILRKVPHLRDMLKGSKQADSLNVKEAQEIINYLNTKIPKEVRSNNIDILEIISDVKAAQSEAFPSQMAQARSSYAKIIEPYNQIKGQFRFNKILKAIENNFGGAEGKEAVKSLLPESIIKEMGGYKTAFETLKHLRQLAPWIGAGLAGSAGYVAGRTAQHAVNPP